MIKPVTKTGFDGEGRKEKDLLPGSAHLPCGGVSSSGLPNILGKASGEKDLSLGRR